mgnify:CR=1 FL=1
MKDLNYITTGLFTSFIPNTAAGESAWRVMNETGEDRILTIHLKSVLSQLRKAGYSVGKSPKPKPIASDDKLLDLLAA